MKAQIVLAACLLLLTTPAALAHTIESDGAITVLLHLDPNDDPPIGQEAVLNFTVTDEKRRFSFEGCECTVTLENSSTDSDQEILSAENFILTSGRIARVTHVFTEKGIYKFGITGKPKPGFEFQSFDIVLEQRVANDGTGLSLPRVHSFHGYHFYIILGIFAVFFILDFYDKLKSKYKIIKH